jgi:hypothetical protein
MVVDVTVVDVIVEATLGRRVVVVDYAGASRTVRPQVIYRTADGEILVDVVQVAGATSGGRALPGWRALRLALIRDATLTAARFRCAPDLNLAAAKYAEVIAHCGQR